MQFGQVEGEASSTRRPPRSPSDDVAGAEEAIEELHEIKGLPQRPDAGFQAVGARIPKGVPALRSSRHRQTLSRSRASVARPRQAWPFYSILRASFDFRRNVRRRLAPAACATLFTQLRKRKLARDHLRRRGSTPFGPPTAAPAWGVATTSAEQTLNQIARRDETGLSTPNTNVIHDRRPHSTGPGPSLDPALLTTPGRFRPPRFRSDAPDMEGSRLEDSLRWHAKGQPHGGGRRLSRCSRARRRASRELTRQRAERGRAAHGRARAAEEALPM